MPNAHARFKKLCDNWRIVIPIPSTTASAAILMAQITITPSIDFLACPSAQTRPQCNEYRLYEHHESFTFHLYQ
eukprot:scaffold12306_cov109-Cylindrotheca_fusiformis.AAC.2